MNYRKARILLFPKHHVITARSAASLLIFGAFALGACSYSSEVAGPPIAAADNSGALATGADNDKGLVTVSDGGATPAFSAPPSAPSSARPSVAPAEAPTAATAPDPPAAVDHAEAPLPLPPPPGATGGSPLAGSVAPTPTATPSPVTSAPPALAAKPTVTVTDCGTDFGGLGSGNPSRNWGTGGWIVNNDPVLTLNVTFEATLVFPDGHVVIAEPQEATVGPGGKVRYDLEGPLPEDPYLADEAAGVSHGSGGCGIRDLAWATA